MTSRCFAALAALVMGLGPMAAAEDVDGVIEHPMIERYPGQEIAWQQIENWRAYRVPVGPVTGYRTIGEWIDVEGRVTRTFYTLDGPDRTESEVYVNFRDGLEAEGFEILAARFSQDRRGNEVGGTSWTGVHFAENSFPQGPQSMLLAGASTSGGAGAIIARKARAEGDAFVVIALEKHAADMIGAMIDIVEVAPVESGLVIVDAEAMGSDMAEFGRVVLDGIVFDFDSAELLPASDAALSNIAAYLQANGDQAFFVVGHTDAVGSFAYNYALSGDRARAVVTALAEDYGIARDRLEPYGVGPLVPVFSNESEAGRDRNRRVELVQRRPEN
ncbi:MAG: OmpA family protein [Pseudomonadota bacterium]